MPEQVSTLQVIGVTVLTLAGVVWAVAVTRIMRRARVEAVLAAFPHQRFGPPPQEYVELSAAEQDAFAGLVRRLGSR
ncbi:MULTISPECIES: hypothetical protein [unclassified Streptomyces]|uniref:hypothetical protein n=1 Tax=unclassified Streptomyces TaxID=2593676 RepID=UPI003710A9A4